MTTSDLFTFYSYDSSWERTFFDDNTGGFVVTSLMRIIEANRSKNNFSIFMKERRMCIKMATFGFQIEHLYEIPGVSSPDISIIKHGAIVRIQGKTAELKQLSSSNNIYKEGINAKFVKGVDLLVIEFTHEASGILRELGRLSAKGVHGYYYYSDCNTYYSF